jgi:HSP20 family protein
MAIRDLIPWKQGREIGMHREDNPFLALHREVNRLFDEAFRGFGPTSLAGFDRDFAWPNIEVGEKDNEVKVVAELPGREEKDVTVEFTDGVLAIRGEKKSEFEEKDQRFSERFYGRFERHIPIEDVDPDKVAASFKNGVLTVTLPKTPQARPQIKRIAINAK